MLVTAMNEEMHERTGEKQEIGRKAQRMRPVLAQNVKRTACSNGCRQHDQETPSEILRGHMQALSMLVRIGQRRRGRRNALSHGAIAHVARMHVLHHLTLHHLALVRRLPRMIAHHGALPRLSIGGRRHHRAILHRPPLCAVRVRSGAGRRTAAKQQEG